ncbi:MAG: MFS transporter, partial [Pseudomonadota bacterium]
SGCFTSPLFRSGDVAGRFVEAAYIPWALSIAAAMAITIFWSAWGTRSMIPFLHGTSNTAKLSFWNILMNLLRDFRDVIRNVNFRYLFTGVLVVFIMVGVTSALDIYMFTYFWELDERVIVPVLLAYAIGNGLGTLVSVRLFAAWGKKACLIFGGLAYAFFQNLPVGLRLMDWFPANGDTLLIPLLVAVKLVQGFSTAQANVAYGSMMADVCDEHEHQTGRRQEGAFFAAVAFSAKATSGFGVVIAGWILQFIEWPIGAQIRTAADVDPDTLLSMAIFYGPGVAALGFISVAFYTRYKLTPQRHAEMLVDLTERRKEAQPQGAE